MRKRARRAGPFHVECPFCGMKVHPGLGGVLTPYNWCSGCYVQFTMNDSGDVVFDDKRKEPKNAWAIALAKSGGATIGAPVSEEGE